MDSDADPDVVDLFNPTPNVDPLILDPPKSTPNLLGFLDRAEGRQGQGADLMMRLPTSNEGGSSGCNERSVKAMHPFVCQSELFRATGDEGTSLSIGNNRMNNRGETDHKCKPGRGGGFGGGRPGGAGGGKRPGPGGDGVPKFSAQNVDPSITIASVGGLDDHIKFLRLAVMYPLKHGEGLKKWGMDPPKGIMFHGPPGTGKTMLAKALCNEISAITGRHVSFYYHKGGESFGMYFGQTEETLRGLFATAIQHKPSIIFFDEIDGLCPNRETSQETSQAYVTVVTAMLGLIDSVKRGDVLIIGATNRLDAVDPAIRRPGRFDKDLWFPLPDEAGRKAILTIHTSKWDAQNKPTGEFLTLVSKKTIGFSGADLNKLCVDTCQIAYIRSENIQVKEEDWTSAFSSMNRSSTNVFGSSLYVSEPIPALLDPLFKPDVTALLGNMRKLLPDGEIGTYLPIKMSVTHSYLVCDENPGDDRYQLTQLMKGLLSHPLLNKYPTYILDVAAISKAHSEQPYHHVTKIIGDLIGQVINCAKPCVLFIPSINILHQAILQLTKEKTGSIFISQLKKIQGSDKFLLASWAGPCNSFPELKTLFFEDHGIYRMIKPNNANRKAFFSQLLPIPFSETTTGKKSNKRKANAAASNKFEEKFLEEIVKVTEGDSAKMIVDLFANVWLRKDDVEQSKKEDLGGALQKILGDYQANKC